MRPYATAPSWRSPGRMVLKSPHQRRRSQPLLSGLLCHGWKGARRLAQHREEFTRQHLNIEVTRMPRQPMNQFSTFVRAHQIDAVPGTGFVSPVRTLVKDEQVKPRMAGAQTVQIRVRRRHGPLVRAVAPGLMRPRREGVMISMPIASHDASIVQRSTP
ncbi:hypothetical protein AERO9AM_10266 [Aeromicrobium sp. 9AM]|nr:hypothetical protein AERO9AM_10266 [Aeromicrobium sp. 9AM]